MKHTLFIIVSALALCACGNKANTDEDRMKQQRDSLQAIIDGKDSELNDIMATMAEIQDGIRRISEAEGRVTIAEGSTENTSDRAVIRDNMEYIREAMEQNRDLIEQLKQKVRASNHNTEKLQKMIDGLQAQISAQAKRIQELEARIAEKDSTILRQDHEITTLSENVDKLSTKTQEQASTLAEQEKDLNTAWFVYGTKNELKSEGILKNGDVLKDANFNKDYFTKIDIRQTKEIKTYSKSARMLTTHPSDSYTIVKDASGQCELKITNSAKFWSVSKYLVMQVK